MAMFTCPLIRERLGRKKQILGMLLGELSRLHLTESNWRWRVHLGTYTRLPILERLGQQEQRLEADLGMALPVRQTASISPPTRWRMQKKCCFNLLPAPSRNIQLQGTKNYEQISSRMGKTIRRINRLAA